jgi:hypothetical protein
MERMPGSVSLRVTMLHGNKNERKTKMPSVEARAHFVFVAWDNAESTFGQSFKTKLYLKGERGAGAGRGTHLGKLYTLRKWDCLGRSFSGKGARRRLDGSSAQKNSQSLPVDENDPMGRWKGAGEPSSSEGTAVRTTDDDDIPHHVVGGICAHVDSSGTP